MPLVPVSPIRHYALIPDPASFISQRSSIDLMGIHSYVLTQASSSALSGKDREIFAKRSYKRLTLHVVYVSRGCFSLVTLSCPRHASSIPFGKTAGHTSTQRLLCNEYGEVPGYTQYTSDNRLRFCVSGQAGYFKIDDILGQLPCTSSLYLICPRYGMLLTLLRTQLNWQTGRINHGAAPSLR